MLVLSIYFLLEVSFMLTGVNYYRESYNRKELFSLMPNWTSGLAKFVTQFITLLGTFSRKPFYENSLLML